MVGILQGKGSKSFGMFYRNTNTIFRSGPGLFIAKDVVAKLNGTITPELPPKDF